MRFSNRELSLSLSLALLAGTLGTQACAKPVDNRPQNTPVATGKQIPAIPAPNTSLYSEYFKPIPPNRNGLITYPHGAIINVTRGINLALDPDNLSAVNTDPEYRIGLQDNQEGTDLNITYFLPQSLQNPADRQAALQMVADQREIVFGLLNAEQHLGRGTLRWSVMSITDLLRGLKSRIQEDTPLKAALGVEISHTYTALSQSKILDLDQTPSIAPTLSPDLRILMKQEFSYPFVVQDIDRGYLAALGYGRYY